MEKGRRRSNCSVSEVIITEPSRENGGIKKKKTIRTAVKKAVERMGRKERNTTLANDGGGMFWEERKRSKKNMED